MNWPLAAIAGRYREGTGVALHTVTMNAAFHHDPRAAADAYALYEETRVVAATARQRWRDRTFVAARLLLGAVFIASAVMKAINFDGTAAAMDDIGIRGAAPLLTLAIGVEGLGGLLLLLGLKAQQTALALAGWMVLVTLGLRAGLSVALGNVAIICGLLFLFAHGAGALSVDGRRERRA